MFVCVLEYTDDFRSPGPPVWHPGTPHTTRGECIKGGVSVQNSRKTSSTSKENYHPFLSSVSTTRPEAHAQAPGVGPAQSVGAQQLPLLLVTRTMILRLVIPMFFVKEQCKGSVPWQSSDGCSHDRWLDAARASCQSVTSTLLAGITCPKRQPYSHESLTQVSGGNLRIIFPSR